MKGRTNVEDFNFAPPKKAPSAFVVKVIAVSPPAFHWFAVQYQLSLPTTTTSGVPCA